MKVLETFFPVVLSYCPISPDRSLIATRCLFKSENAHSEFSAGIPPRIPLGSLQHSLPRPLAGLREEMGGERRKGAGDGSRGVGEGRGGDGITLSEYLKFTKVCRGSYQTIDVL